MVRAEDPGLVGTFEKSGDFPPSGPRTWSASSTGASPEIRLTRPPPGTRPASYHPDR